MSDAENISLWKKKSEIDYIPLFMSLWLSLNAWLRDKFNEKTDRGLIELLKSGDNKLGDEFEKLINRDDAQSITFKGYFSELNSALENASLKIHKLPVNLQNTNNVKISFKTVILDWNNGSPSFGNVVKNQDQRYRIKVSDNFYIDNDIKRVFRAYIENLYQVRCVLFHGNLSPKPENERVVKAFYLTLSTIMQRV